MNLMTMNRKRRHDLDFSNQEIGVYDFKRDHIVSKTDFGHIINQTNYTRASITFMADANGLYHRFAANEAAQTNLGMKISPVVENLIRSSRNLAYSPDWNGYNLVTDNYAEAPNGLVEASNIVGITNSEGMSLNQVYLGSTSLMTFIAHAWVKAEGIYIGRELIVRLKRNGGDYIAQETSITLTNQWQRVEVILDTLANTDGLQFIFLSASSTPLNVLIWAPQLEIGSYANDSIITEAGVTGVSDATTVFDDVSAFGLTEFTFVSDLNFQSFGSIAYSRLVSITDGTTNNRVFIRQRNKDGTSTLQVTQQGESSQTVNDLAIPLGDNKIAISCSLTQVKVFCNGGIVATLNLARPFTEGELTRLGFASAYNGANRSVVTFRKFTLYDVALFDAQIMELTL